MLYFLKVALGLVQSTDQQRCGLHELLVFLLRRTLANQDSIVIGKHDALYTVELIDHPFKKLRTFSPHKLRSNIKLIVI